MKNKPYPYYEIPQVKTIKELVANGVAKGGDRPMLYYDVNNETRVKTFRDVGHEIDCLGTYLMSLGLKGAKIAILGENSYYWCAAYFAAVNGVGVAVPLDKEMPAEDLKKIVKKSGCTACFYSDKYKNVIDFFKEGEDAGITVYLPMDKTLEYVYKGEEMLENGDESFTSQEVKPDDLACIVFTSGTTGKSKGVMLTHGNLASDVVATCQCVKAGNAVLVLPLNHTFSWASALFAAFLYVEHGYICPNLKNVVSDFKKYEPQNFSAVPMVIEMIYKTIWDTAEKQGKAEILRKGLKISNKLLKYGIDIRKKLFKEVLSNFGGKLEVIICGGAALDIEYQKGLYEMGITVINGYGITECSPVVAVNRNEYFKLGSCGQALPCNEIKIHEPDAEGVGEIYVKGSNVMLGYYGDEEETAAAFDGEWFKTGDYGRLDSDGFLYITGRKKNLIILSNGKNISPEEIEEKLQKIKFVKEVLVYEEDKTITAEFYLDEENYPDAKSMINDAVAQYNRNAAVSKRVGKIKTRDDEFPKTTTLKIKRNYGK